MLSPHPSAVPSEPLLGYAKKQLIDLAVQVTPAIEAGLEQMDEIDLLLLCQQLKEATSLNAETTLRLALVADEIKRLR